MSETPPKAPLFIDNYPIDVVISEDHTFDNVVTDNPVERGANTTDHSRVTSDVHAYEGLVSNSPIGAMANARIGVVPVTDAYTRLKEIRARHQPVVLEDSLGVWPDMMLATLTVPRGQGNPNTALRFRVTFKQARFVSNERTIVRVSAPIAAKKKNLGNLATDKDKQAGADAAARSRKRSMLVKLRDSGVLSALGGGLGL